MTDIRVRHTKGRKRATLVTVREGDMLYFGIARCNTRDGDVFNKQKGRFIAEGRAFSELEAHKNHPDMAGLYVAGLMIHTSGLKGCCHIEDVKTLLSYFDNIHKNQFVVVDVPNRWQQLAGVDECEEGCTEGSCEGCELSHNCPGF
jgi:hypothetical protein